MSKQIEKIKELIAKREQARLGGGEKAIEKQHARGKYTARCTAATTSAWKRNNTLATAWLLARQLLMDDWCMYMHKTSPLMVVRSLKRCRRKSVRLWIWP